MQFRSESTIRFPRARVYAAYRDHLAEIADYIPDIREIIVRRRTDAPGGVSLHNEWVADREIPAYARPFVTPDQLRWDDYAEWRDERFVVEWRIETRTFREAVSCRGTNTFLAANEGATEVTRVVLAGDLSLDLARIRGVPRLLTRLAPQVESFVVSLITPNLERVNASIERYLTEADRGRP